MSALISGGSFVASLWRRRLRLPTIGMRPRCVLDETILYGQVRAPLFRESRGHRGACQIFQTNRRFSVAYDDFRVTRMRSQTRAPPALAVRSNFTG